MYMTFVNRESGMATRAYFRKSTMIRTMRRYRCQEIIDADLTPRPIRLANARRVVRGY